MRLLHCNYAHVISYNIYLHNVRDNQETEEMLVPFMFSPAHTASGGMCPLIAFLNVKLSIILVITSRVTSIMPSPLPSKDPAPQVLIRRLRA